MCWHARVLFQEHVFRPPHDTMLGRARFEESGHLGKALLSISLDDFRSDDKVVFYVYALH